MKRIPVAVANWIMECVKVIWRAYFHAELENASFIGTWMLEGRPALMLLKKTG